MSSNSSRRGVPQIAGVSGSGSDPMNGFGIGGPSINSGTNNIGLPSMSSAND